MIVSVYQKLDNNALYFADLEKNGEINGKIPLTPIVPEFKNSYEVKPNKFEFIFMSIVNMG